MDQALQQKGRGAFPWPTVWEMLALKRTRSPNLGRFLRVSGSLAHARLHGSVLRGLVATCPHGVALFRQCPNLYRALIDNYVDKRLRLPARLRLIGAELRHVMGHLRRAGWQDFSAGDSRTLWQAPDGGWHVDFRLNAETPQEGLWMLALKDGHGEQIYGLSFACVGDRLVIGAVQGPRGEQALAMVRDATKALHGIRPHFFLVEVLRALAAAWGMSRLVGVDPQFHITPTMFYRKREGVKFDYVSFWTELGGALDGRRDWVLPLVAQRKSMNEIESKKRAMYRRRFAMLDALRHDVAQTFGGDTSSAI